MKLTEAEWKVMNVVWERYPCTARDVLKELKGETDWAYTTAKTILTRLVNKGVLSTTMRENASIYEPKIRREDAQHSELRSLLERAFDGAVSPMMQFVVAREGLSKKERADIHRMLEEAEKDGA